MTAPPLPTCGPCGTPYTSLTTFGACWTCGQRPDANPGDPCALCGGEGVVDGLVVGEHAPGGPERCWACKGFGVVPLPEPVQQVVAVGRSTRMDAQRYAERFTR